MKAWMQLELGDSDGALQTVKQMEMVEPTKSFHRLDALGISLSPAEIFTSRD